MSSRLLLTPGRARGLQQCALAEGVFAILAADHRDAMRVLIDRERPQEVSAAQLTALKLAIVRHLAPEASAVLLDPPYGAGQAIAAGVLPGGVGLVVAWEEQGYLGDPYGRQTTLLAGWGAEKARRPSSCSCSIIPMPALWPTGRSIWWLPSSPSVGATICPFFWNPSPILSSAIGPKTALILPGNGGGL